MAARATDLGGQRIFDLFLKGVVPSIPSPGSWFSLFTTGPTHDHTTDVELSGYSRLAMGSWTYSGTWPNLYASQAVQYIVDPMPACVVTGWGLHTDPTAGEFLFFEQLSPTLTFNAGDRFVIPAGAIAVNLTL